jgi:hypothetical protein
VGAGSAAKPPIDPSRRTSLTPQQAAALGQQRTPQDSPVRPGAAAPAAGHPVRAAGAAAIGTAGASGSGQDDQWAPGRLEGLARLRASHPAVGTATAAASFSGGQSSGGAASARPHHSSPHAQGAAGRSHASIVAGGGSGEVQPTDRDRGLADRLRIVTQWEFDVFDFTANTEGRPLAYISYELFNRWV